MADKTIKIDAEFPGGNIVVESIDGDVARVRPDQRTSTDWWFYWYFRIRGAAGRTLRFQFDRPTGIGNAGPCVSFDNVNWQWLGAQHVDGASFALPFPANADEAYLSVSFPYTAQHLNEYLESQPAIERSALVVSEEGRPVELLTRRSARGTWTVLLTARTHACETMGSYALEGILDFWNVDEPEAAFLREQVDFVAIPFIDKDGVEAGDQGKLRGPHDHNRDFGNVTLYAVTRAFQSKLPEWAPRVRLALDLHCPWIKGGRNDELFLVGSPDPWAGHEATFTRLLSDSQQGELRYDPRHTIPCNVEWNVGENPTMSRYVRRNTPALIATTFEIPYSLAGGQIVTAANVRTFGRDLGRAIARFHQQTH